MYYVSSNRQVSETVFVNLVLSSIVAVSGVDGVGPLLQIAAVCCSGWPAARAWVSRPGHWAAGSHRGCGAADGRSPLGAVV